MKIRFTTILCLLAALGATVVSAQNIPYVKKGDFELGLFAGESYGLDRFRPMAGGNVAFALSRWCFPFAEGSYLPGSAPAECAHRNHHLSPGILGRYDRLPCRTAHPSSAGRVPAGALWSNWIGHDPKRKEHWPDLERQRFGCHADRGANTRQH